MTTRLILTLITLCLLPHHLHGTLCKVPLSLTGKRILLEVNGQYAINNPRAGELQEFIFTQTLVTARSLHNKETEKGNYRYQVLTPDVGLMTTSLMQKDKVISTFNLAFMCQDNVTGRYIFSQSQGIEKPDVRQNVGTYFIMSQD